MLKNRFEYAIGKAQTANIASQIGVDFLNSPTTTWDYNGNDKPSLFGLIPRPRFFVLLWQDLIKTRRSIEEVLEQIWESHLANASDEIEAFLSARYKDITPLLRKIRESNNEKISASILADLRKRAINSAPTGALWVTAQETELLENMCLAGYLVKNQYKSDDYRIRKKLFIN